MWCRNCQQDVPGIASPEDRQHICCARCGLVVSGGNAASNPTPATPLKTVASAAKTSPVLDDADLEAQLEKARRLAKRFKSTPPMESPAATIPAPHVRFDAPHVPQQPRPRTTTPDKRSATLAWVALCPGLMAFVCGAVLLGWSFWGQRPDLWNLGLPLALVGQAGLVIGLVLQLDSLWQTHRQANDTLAELDEEVHELRHTTAMLGNTHGASAQSFYAHLADGARPEMLLADLKGQLDLLATRLARRAE